jgi:hypothetical protein
MVHMRQWVSMLRSYFWRNPGAPFIIGFQVSLLVCAGLLISGGSVLVDGVATVAYFFLVFGVVLQLISYLVQKKENL